MYRHALRLIALLLVAACTQQPAPVDYRGSYYYGQDSSKGMEAPKYSDWNRAELPAEQEDKYKSDIHDYGVAAEVSDVSTSDLPPPGSELQPSTPPQQAQEAYKAGGTGTVVDPKLTQAPKPGQGYYDYNTNTNVPPITERASVSMPPASADPNAEVSTDYYSKEAAEVEAAAAPQFIWPVRGDIVTPYSASSQGVAIKASKGDPVRAAADGSVQSVSPKDGKMVVILTHPGGWTSQYGQLGETVVRLNDQVVRGQLVGFAGGTQIFFGAAKGGKSADPRAMMVDD